jgi:LysM repeat protein
MSQSKETKYTVKRGDTLKSIALENNLTVEAILNANPDIADPEDLRSGQSIVLPLLNTSGYSSGDYYTVKVGDTLESIAKEHGTTVDAILLKNPKLIDTDSVEAGETIEIPKAHASQIPPPPATCSGRYYTVVAGDSLYLIAQRNNITLDALLAANPQITDPARISVGQVICVPGTTPSCEGTLYTIRAGDTLFSLAQRYNTTVDAIIRANPGIDPSNLRIGQVICIPSSTPGPVPCPGGTLYTIRAGDTLFALAQRYNTTVDAILRANPGIDPNNLRVGQIICIPGTGPVPCPGGTLYTIRAGDTLFSLAQRFNVTVDAIIQANPGIDPNNLRVGQVICIPGTGPVPCPGGTLYTIRAGDTLFSIAQRFNVTVDAILRANPGIDPNNLRIGQEICIPGTGPAPCPGGTLYTIRAGDTLFSLAQRYNTTVDAILRANPGIDPNNLRVGQVICIPGTGPVPCPGGTLYTIRAGDTLFSLAQRFNVTVDAVLRANPGIDPNNLRIGQEICIPAATLEIESRMECPGTIYTIRQGDSLYQLAIRYNTTVDRIMRFNPGIDPNNLQIGQRICIPTGTHDVSGKRCQVLMRTSSAPRAEGFGIYDFDCNNVSALAIDLPDPEGCGGRVYKMFVRERNTHHWHSATMYASPDGIWVGIVRLPRTLDMYDLVQISAESRESTSPIGVVVLRGDISKA